MKLFCPISGVSYTTNIGYGHGQAPHPIFYFSLEQLTTQFLEPYTRGKLEEKEIHLLGCALLHTLPVQWEVAVEPSEKVNRIWRRNLEKLASAALWYDDRSSSQLPKYRIDKNTSTLHNLDQYVKSLTTTTILKAPVDSNDWETEADITETLTDNELVRAEETILAIVRSALNKAGKKQLPSLMAQWAASVGNFSEESISYPSSMADKGTVNTTLKKHWQYIIIKAFETTEYVNLLSEDITLADISELVEHCETEIEAGTLHYSILMKKLRAAKNVIEEFTSPAPMSQIQIVEHHEELAASLLGEASSSTLTDSTSLAPLAPTTPEHKVPTSAPLRKDYPSNASYLAAKLRYSRSKTNA